MSSIMYIISKYILLGGTHDGFILLKFNYYTELYNKFDLCDNTIYNRCCCCL